MMKVRVRAEAAPEEDLVEKRLLKPQAEATEQVK